MIFCDYLLSLSIFSRFICFVPCIRENYSSLLLITSHCTATAHFIHLFFSWWTYGLSHFWALMKYTAMNIYVQIFMWTYIFICLQWNIHSILIFHGSHVLYSHQVWTGKYEAIAPGGNVGLVPWRYTGHKTCQLIHTEPCSMCVSVPWCLS